MITTDAKFVGSHIDGIQGERVAISESVFDEPYATLNPYIFTLADGRCDCDEKGMPKRNWYAVRADLVDLRPWPRRFKSWLKRTTIRWISEL